MIQRYHTSTYHWKRHFQRSSYRLRLMQSLKHHALGAGVSRILSHPQLRNSFHSHLIVHLPLLIPHLLPPHNRWRHPSLRSWTKPNLPHAHPTENFSFKIPGRREREPLRMTKACSESTLHLIRLLQTLPCIIRSQSQESPKNPKKAWNRNSEPR